jgi:hypothetical protein
VSYFDQIVCIIKAHNLTGTLMQVFWEKIGILGPVYRRLGSGLSDREIAYDLDITELRVQQCVAWMQHFLLCKDRKELAHEASHPRVM